MSEKVDIWMCPICRRTVTARVSRTYEPNTRCGPHFVGPREAENYVYIIMTKILNWQVEEWDIHGTGASF